jgi:serine protease
VAGLAPGVTILPIKVFDADGVSTATRLAQGIDYAVYRGADIINFSGGSSSPSEEVRLACQRAYQAGVLIVAAAGNDGKAELSYPAAHPTVLAVGAIRLDLTRSYYSNHSTDMVMAPGGDTRVDQNHDGYGDGILQQYLDGDYWFLQGTSMAAPHVAGLAALLLSEAKDLGLDIPDGSARVDWLMNIITSRTMDLGAPGTDSEFGHGLVMAEHALAFLDGVECQTPPLGCYGPRNGD